MRLNSLMRSIYGKHISVQIVLMTLLSFCTASAQFLITYHLGRIIDSVSLGSKETLTQFIIIFTSFVFYMLGLVIWNLFSGRMGAKFTLCLHKEINRKVCLAQYKEIEQIKDGDLITSITKDSDNLKNWLLVLLKLGNIPAQLGLVVVFLFQYHWKFSLFMLCLFPLASIPEVLISKRIHSHYVSENNKRSDVLSFFTETMNHSMIIKAFRLEGLFQKKNKRKLDELKELHMKCTRHAKLVEIYGRDFGHITNVLMLMLGAYFILAGEMTIGMLTSVILLAGFAGEGINILNEVPICLQAGKASALRVQAILEMQDESDAEDEVTQASLNPNEPVFKLQLQHFNYGNITVLHDINVNINEGEKIAIVGASGCGKTTLFKLLSGLYQSEQNQIYFKGIDISKLSPQYLRKHITVTTQETFLFQTTFLENISIAKQGSSDEAVQRAAQKAQINDFIQSKENGYHTVVNTTVQSISNGQMQRINLARAFLKDTEVLLLDEPTSALDPITTKLILDSLFPDYIDRTILMIVHNLQEIKRFDKVLMLHAGTVVGFGTHEELLTNCKEYRLLSTADAENEQKEVI